MYTHINSMFAGVSGTDKKLRHDMKHHLIELSAIAQHGKNEDMVRYVEQMENLC